MKGFIIPKKDILRPVISLLEKDETIVIEEQEKKLFQYDLSEEVRTVSLECKTDSVVDLVISQTKKDTYSIFKIEIYIKKNAICRIWIDLAQTKRTNIFVVAHLEEEESRADITGAFHGNKDTHHGFYALMHHAHPHTRGDIKIKGVYEDNSRGVFSGLIKIDKIAQQALSYFKDDILLTDNGIAESLPTLEIEANDVKASHGSTTSRVNSDQLFYLQSRGFSYDEAKDLIIQGFLDSIRTRIPNPQETRKELKKMIH